MKFKGKVAVWFWIIFIVGEAVLLHELIFSRDDIAALIIGILIFNIVFLPVLIRNYIMVNNESVTICFGFAKDSIKIEDIVEVYQTYNPIASSAASFDRIVIKGKRNEIMCSVKEKTKLFEELRNINNKIVFRN